MKLIFYLFVCYSIYFSYQTYNTYPKFANPRSINSSVINKYKSVYMEMNLKEDNVKKNVTYENQEMFFINYNALTFYPSKKDLLKINETISNLDLIDSQVVIIEITDYSPVDDKIFFISSVKPKYGFYLKLVVSYVFNFLYPILLIVLIPVLILGAIASVGSKNDKSNQNKETEKEAS